MKIVVLEAVAELLFSSCRSSLPITAQCQVTHLTPTSVNSLLTQQVPSHAAPATGRGQMELLLCVSCGFHPSSPLPRPSAILPCAWTAVMALLVYGLCYCALSRAVVINYGTHCPRVAHPHSSAASLISH